jgi:uncharacterized protein (TIGR02996 family)
MGFKRRSQSKPAGERGSSSSPVLATDAPASGYARDAAIARLSEEATSAVYADPSDDDARLQLADALDGRPRAELIRLQLGGAAFGAASKTERALLKAHSDAWLVPLRGAIVKSTVKWARGFPVAGRLAFHRQPETLVQLPALATIEDLDVGGGDLVHDYDFLSRFLLQSSLRHLRVLRGVPGRLAAAFLGADPPFQRLERLDFGMLGGTSDAQAPWLAELREGMAAGAGLPALRELTHTLAYRVDAQGIIRTHPREDYDWLWSTPLGRRIQVLRVETGPEELLFWHAALAEPPPQLQRLECLAGGCFALERADGGWRLVGQGASARTLLAFGRVAEILQDRGVSV